MTQIETKDQLLEKLHESREALEKIIAKTNPEAMLRPGVCGEWSGKDVLAHVAHWQELHLGWWSAAQRGDNPQVPAPGFSWKREDVDKLNQQIYLAHKNQSLPDILVYLRSTFDQFMALVKATSEVDLFTPGLVPFIGNTTLARWYKDYAMHDGFARNHIYNALVRKKQGTVKEILTS